MNAPPPPRPPEPMATIWIARKPGAKPVDVIVGEAEAERAIADLSAALAAIRAGKQAIEGMQAPRGGHPYPQPGVVEATVYCGKTHPDDGAWCELDDGHPGTHYYMTNDGREVTWGDCAAVAPDSGAVCALPHGHDGRHESGDRPAIVWEDDSIASDEALPPCAACGDAEILHEPQRPGEPIATGPCAACGCTAYALPQDAGEACGLPVFGAGEPFPLFAGHEPMPGCPGERASLRTAGGAA